MNLFFRLFLCVNYLFGVWIFIRYTKILEHNFTFKKSTLVKIKSLHIVFILSASLYSWGSYEISCIGAHLPFFCMKLYEQWVKFLRKRVFEKHFRGFLNQMIFQMKLGHCFRESFGKTLKFCPNFVQIKLKQIENIVVFSQQHYLKDSPQKLFQDITQSFLRADQSPHMSIQILEILEHKLKVKQYFSEKVKQILYRVWFQVILLGFFYLALLIYILNQYSLRENLGLIATSNIIFLAGTLLLIYLGRSFKWKL